MKDYSGRVGMPGWHGWYERGKRPAGVHPSASVGGPPEHRDWMAGDPLLEPVIHPSALVHAFCTVDAGMPGKQATTIGPRSWLQARVHVGHNAVVGADCEICAGVVICGEVVIGDGVKVGGGSWIKPLVRVGDGAVIGGGSVVTKDVPAHEVWAGNPARFMKLAWTHPDYEESAPHSPPEPQWEHPLRDVEEVWGYMSPWHRRDLERRDPRGAALLRELDEQRHVAFVAGDVEAAATLLNKHEAVSGRVGPVEDVWSRSAGGEAA